MDVRFVGERLVFESETEITETSAMRVESSQAENLTEVHGTEPTVIAALAVSSAGIVAAIIANHNSKNGTRNDK